ncbi:MULTISPECIES: ABC transporter permease [unclassified Shinella]|uniref:ABC transporter permease n=1 Tax=unclassified Shinella TaxID=2643062 RepID=UPI00225CFB27|nr:MULTISPECIES: ABC transporter permease [unclassified Shinella]MCO5139762.1 ABC transporter permease [Shinella sp.]MDC7258601.1 ABC transporter permease [Shinella sp. YE25]CAI0334945.1 Spermidine Putrescine ABC transporter permease component potB (TC_3.A.1.11.1) [Rhizobiaceae bacterium]CAK7260365.1 spermidine/putrescine transport system permease protein [Shinella sp. WSC3-e]
MTESALHAAAGGTDRSPRARFWRDLSFWGLLPSWLLMGLALILPIAIIAAVSLATRGAHGGFTWDFNLAGYRQILFNEGWTGELEFTPQYLLIVARTFALAGATTLICLIFAVPVAYFISRQPPGRKAALVYLVTLPFWVSMILRVYAWMIILGKDGTLPRFLETLGLPAGMSFMFNDGATLTAMVYTAMPLMVLPVFASIEKLDGTLIEASHDLYGNRWVTLRRVILPLTAPGLVAGAILVFVPALGAVLEPSLMGGGKQMMMGTLIQLQFGGGRNWPFGAAIAMTLMALVLVFLLVMALRAARREDVR